jgi:hypothetical protein
MEDGSLFPSRTTKWKDGSLAHQERYKFKDRSLVRSGTEQMEGWKDRGQVRSRTVQREGRVGGCILQAGFSNQPF